jgi:hypothetical protein
MHVNGFIGSVGALRRKLRALTSVAEDAGATASERANAQALKKILEQRLREAEPPPAGDWTDNAFRLGRWARELQKSMSPQSPKGDWTDNAHRLGTAVRRGYRKWWSD